MTAQPIPRQALCAHPHPHTRPATPVKVAAPNTPITLTVMPAHAGIQRLGSCEVRP